ncbi:MAG: SOS response-associated peptidase family protein [Pseudomonadota bacterium]
MIDSPVVQELMIKIGLGDLVGKVRGGQSYLRQSLRDMIFATPALLHMRDAVWWYAHKRQEGRYVPDWDITSFNARNLDRPRWREALQYRRGLVIVDTLGESNPVPNRKTPQRYLMESEEPLLIGTVYKEWDDGTLSAAVITRDPHPGYSRFHKKSMPLFLPEDPDFISVWLDPNIRTHPMIDAVLAEPKLYHDLYVTPVVSYKSAKPQGETERLERDPDVD